MSVSVGFKQKHPLLEIRGLSRDGLEEPLSSVTSAPLPTPRALLPPDTEHLATLHDDSDDYDDLYTPVQRQSPLMSTRRSLELGSLDPICYSNLLETGGATERSTSSSTSSLSDVDEYDRQNTRKVKHMFENIDSLLYEGTSLSASSSRSDLNAECLRWTSNFPHFRVLGKQLVPDMDEGFSFTPSTAPSTATPSGCSAVLMDVTESEAAGSDLLVVGKCNRLHRVSPSDSSAEVMLNEEVYADDGEYEEIIARDNSSDDGVERRPRPPRGGRRPGYPPITPNASLQDAVESTTFDSLWQDVVSATNKLYRRLAEQITTGDGTIDNVRTDISALFPDAATLAANKLGALELNRDDTTLSSMSRVMNASQKNEPMAPKNNADKLAGLLNVAPKQIQRRERSNLGESLEEPSDTTVGAFSSMQVPKARASSVRLHERHSSAKARLRPHRLPTLDSKPVGTPNTEVEPARGLVEVRGKAMSTADRLQTERLTADRLISPLGFSRNNTLPPLDSIEPRDTSDSVQQRGVLGGSVTHLPQTSALLQARRLMPGRASTALDKDNRSLYKSRDRFSVTYTELNRPSTTHTVRSDGQYGPLLRRSSTPLGPSTRSSKLMTGITGVSIGGPGGTSGSDLRVSDDPSQAVEMNQPHWVPSQQRRARTLYYLVK